MPIESNGCKYPSAAIFTGLFEKRLLFAVFGLRGVLRKVKRGLSRPG